MLDAAEEGQLADEAAELLGNVAGMVGCPRGPSLAKSGRMSCRKNHGSMDWFKGKFTGNHRFSH